MKDKKYRSRAIIEASRKIEELDSKYDDDIKIARLIYEDDRRKLVTKKTELVKKRDRSSLIFVLSLAVLFGLIFIFNH